MKKLLTCESGVSMLRGGYNFWAWTEEYQNRMYAFDDDETYVVEVEDSAIIRDDLVGQSFWIDGKGQVTEKGLYKGD